MYFCFYVLSDFLSVDIFASYYTILFNIFLHISAYFYSEDDIYTFTELSGYKLLIENEYSFPDNADKFEIITFFNFI